MLLNYVLSGFEPGHHNDDLAVLPISDTMKRWSGFCILARKMTSFRQSENIIAL